MDALLVVVDEGPWSIQTAHRVRALAKDIGVENLSAVVNRVSESTDVDQLRRSLEGIPIVGTIPYDRRLAAGIVGLADEQVLNQTDVLTEFLPRIDSILQLLTQQNRNQEADDGAPIRH